MRRLGFAAALALLLAVGCGGKKKDDEKPPEQAAESSEPADEEPECEVDDDCRANELCLDGECTSTARGGVYTNPRRAVTPEKVKREVEKRMQQGQDRIDRGMNMGEE